MKKKKKKKCKKKKREEGKIIMNRASEKLVSFI